MERPARAESDRNVADFLSGVSHRAYAWFGAHPVQQGSESGWFFRVWAPRAAAVSVVGPFNGWTVGAHPMTLVRDGIWEVWIAGLSTYEDYQYAVQTADGEVQFKADPYAFHAQTRPDAASKLYDLDGYPWADGQWMDYRRRRPLRGQPLNLYEVHLGSWRRTGDGRFLSYRDIARWLVPYVKEMGFTGVSLMPVTEHMRDESWGYQCTGYFAPTSRFGTPHDFMYLIDQLHQAGVAVLMDWVPAHFPTDEHGLYRFDGAPCYEYEDPLKAEFPGWNTQMFNYSRPEVCSFLLSSALFWLREYHLDGLRVDSVASMLYLDYDGRPWQPNEKGGRENLEAVAFLRRLNTTVAEQFPDVLMVAEESTSWPHVTGRTESDPAALGFDFKWNTGWAHDVLHYLHLDPIYRQYNHKDLTFSMMYAFSERFILPLSHNEVVRGKNSLVGRMPGDDQMKFAGVRVFYLYMLTHPGRKLLMMGTELGQFNEWRYQYSLDWHLLDYPPFRRHQAYFRAANQFYLTQPALWEEDDSWDGFQWICPDDASGNTFVYLRRDHEGRALIVALNASPVARMGYRIGVPYGGVYRVLFHSDSTDHGGQGRVENRPICSAPIASHRFRDSIQVDLPPMTGLVLSCISKAPRRRGAAGLQ